MTMNVSLTPELEDFVNDKVKMGLYSSASEVVRESLRLLRRQGQIERLQLDELRREIQSSTSHRSTKTEHNLPINIAPHCK